MYNSRSNASPRSFHFKKLKTNPARKLYKSCMNSLRQSNMEGEYGVFGSSINFINDLVEIGHSIMKRHDRKSALSEYLQ